MHTKSGRTANYVPNPVKLSAALVAWIDDDHSNYLNIGLSALGLLADHWPKEADLIIERLSSQPWKLATLVENPDVASIFARLNPELCLRAATVYYLEWPPEEDTWTIAGMPVPPAPDDKEKDDGVRDHASQYFWRRKYLLAGPMFGPFAALLTASPENGLKLVGAIVEAATEARVKLENSWHDTSPTTTAPIVINMTYPDTKTTKPYRGTANVWVWYRGGGTGPYPAMSALMALREWALQEAEQRPVSEVAAQILNIGNSIAFLAVALSIFVARINDVTDELDPFLEQPIVWRLENARIGQEAHNSDYPLPNNDLLRVPLDRIAMHYLLRSNEAHRQVLKGVGERLVQAMEAQLTAYTGAQPQQNHPDMLVARKWAGLLNYDLYRFEKADENGTTAVSINYPAAKFSPENPP